MSRSVDGGYMGMEITFGPDVRADVHFTCGTLAPDDIDLKRVLVKDGITGELKDWLGKKFLSSREIAEIRQHIAYLHAKERKQ